MALPFLLGAQHGLVVRGAHDDAVFVGELRVERIVLVEGVAPHGGPEIVALEPQDQLEDLHIEVVIVSRQTSRLTQPERAGASSLRKMPRYFTAGGPWRMRPGFTYRAS